MKTKGEKMPCNGGLWGLLKNASKFYRRSASIAEGDCKHTLQLHLSFCCLGILREHWIGQRISDVSNHLYGLMRSLRKCCRYFECLERTPCCPTHSELAMCWQEGMRQLLRLFLVSLCQFLKFNSMQEAYKVKWELLFFSFPFLACSAVPPLWTYTPP